MGIVYVMVVRGVVMEDVCDCVWEFLLKEGIDVVV